MTRKLQIISQIEKYHQSWPRDYGEYRPVDPTRVTLEQLEARFSEMQAVRDTKLGPSMAKAGLGWLGVVIEQGWQNVCYGNPAFGPLAGMSLASLGSVLGSDAGYQLFEEELTEYRILYPGLFSQPRWLRFTSKLAQVIKQVAEANRATPQARAPMPNAENYDDL
jgi:hypothetical protein